MKNEGPSFGRLLFKVNALFFNLQVTNRYTKKDLVALNKLE